MAAQALQRATILIAVGALGEQVLRRLLVTSLPRGVLDWTAPDDGASPNERSLRNLALIAVRRDEPTAALGGDQFTQDLFQQIDVVDNDAGTLEDAVIAAWKRLLDASERGDAPIGLDVMVVAHIRDGVDVGALDVLLERAMDHLAFQPIFQRGAKSGAVLNFLRILDFDGYWLRDKAEMRAAVHRSADQHHARRTAVAAQEAGAAFGRTYMVDSITDDGSRDPTLRIDEICLFIEFLLFEEQRAGGRLQHAYQPTADQCELASFGVRLMERSSGLLRRLAAAIFAHDWLRYLATEHRRSQRAIQSHTEEALAEYDIHHLLRLLKREDLEHLLRQALGDLEGRVLAIPAEEADWAQQIAGACRTAESDIRERLTEEITLRVREVRDRFKGTPDQQSQRRSGQFARRVEDAISADLHDPNAPWTPAAVLALLKNVLAELEQSMSGARPAEDVITPAVREAAALHARWRRFDAGMVNAEALKRWWPLFAIVCAAIFAPQVEAGLASVPQPDLASSFAWRLLARVLRAPWLNNAATLTAAVGFLAYIGGRFLPQRWIARRVQRLRRFYSDPERGRIAHFVRRLVEPGGPLDRSLRDFLDQALRDAEQTLRGSLAADLRQFAERLEDRRREMLWLREQLRYFLQGNGVPLHVAHEQLEMSRPPAPVRTSKETMEDLHRMLLSIPPQEVRFQAMQADMKPFVQWHSFYCDDFLYPLRFLDDLAKLFRDPAEARMDSNRGAECLEFLCSDQARFNVGFWWPRRGEGGALEERFCILPQTWAAESGVQSQLMQQLSVAQNNIVHTAENGRLYLLKLWVGLPTGLLEAPDAAA